MKHHFTHEFEDDPSLGDFDVELDPPPGARIRFDVNGTGVWLSANRVGWLHLAKICAEMALHSGFSPGYHFHRTRDWQDSFAAAPHDVSFELSADEQTIQLAAPALPD